MKIAIIGAGGIGGFFGAKLAAAGHDVHFTARGAHKEAMERNGLQVHSPMGDVFIAHPSVRGSVAGIGPCDVVMVGVKMVDLDAVASTLKPLIADDTAIVSFQNGVEAEGILADALGREHVLGAVVYMPAEIAEPGVIRHHSDFARLVFGEMDGTVTPRVKALADALQEAGIEGVITEQVEVEIWRKFVFLAATAGTTAFYREPMGPILGDAEKRATFEALVAETTAVARARGVVMPDDTVAATMALADSMPAGMRSSMQTDLERGKPLELEWITGAVVRLGREHGVETPRSREIHDALLPFAKGAPTA